jgi:hypothetical protein
MEIYYSKALLKFVKNKWKKKVNFYKIIMGFNRMKKAELNNK